MSSYVVDPKVINIMVSAFLKAGTGSRTLAGILQGNLTTGLLFVESAHDTAKLGQELYDLNISATSQRYPNSDLNNLPGSYRGDILVKYQFSAIPSTARELYASIGEFIYQCSEGDADETPLFKNVSAYLDALAHYIVNNRF